MFFTQLQQTNEVNKALKGKVILKVLVNKRTFIFGMIILELSIYFQDYHIFNQHFRKAILLFARHKSFL